MTGAFHGAMDSTTPQGWRVDMAKLPGLSEGMVSPFNWVVIAAASRRILAASWQLKMAHPRVPPVSEMIASTKSSVRAKSRSAERFRQARRCVGGVADQTGKARAATLAA